MKKRRAGQSKPQMKALWHALDEAAFGPERTLNLRETLPSASEARARIEVWLRARQVTCTEEVLVITGRGNQSVGGVGVIRQEILALLPSLRRRGIVSGWREHTAGSLVVKLAPLSALLGAGKRRRDATEAESVSTPEAIAGLRPTTSQLLRQLANMNLNALGIVSTEQFVNEEMARTFSMLIKAVPAGVTSEAALHNAILNAINEQSDT